MIEALASAAVAQPNGVHSLSDAQDSHARGPYLAPIERPSNALLKVAYWFMRRQFGKVMGPVAVFSARMPWAFTSFSMKVAKLDKKLVLAHDTAILVREQVAGINGCLFCQDAARWAALRESMERKPKLDALHDYASSPLFSDAERAALDYATELTRDKYVSPETFARLRSVYSEREICDIVWLVASEHLWNMSNIGLGWASAPTACASSTRNCGQRASNTRGGASRWRRLQERRTGPPGHGAVRPAGEHRKAPRLFA